MKKHAKTTGKPASPLPRKMRGLHRRGKIFWRTGMRTQISLDTEGAAHGGIYRAKRRARRLRHGFGFKIN